MDKKKKAIIAVILLVVLLIILGIVWYFVINNNNSKQNNSSLANVSEISKLYKKLQEANVFSFETILDEENYTYYAKSNDAAYINTVNNNKENKYLIQNGKTYLLVEDTKTFYTYNNSLNLNMIIKGLEEIKDLEYETGKEKINNKNYTYEEYSVLTDFAKGEFTEESQDVKTRFYFDDGELVYIKTIEEDKEELLKVNISYDVDQNLFQIPSDYTKA